MSTEDIASVPRQFPVNEQFLGERKYAQLQYHTMFSRLQQISKCFFKKRLKFRISPTLQ